MADFQTGRLCVQIIHSNFGPITASVVSVLLTRGRLPLHQLIRLSGHKPRTVAASVLALVQHNLVWHAQTEDEGEILEANINECLMRLRFGKFTWLAEQLFGKLAADVIQVVLDHGKLRPPEILFHLGINELKSSTVYSHMIHTLVSASYLKPSTASSHISPKDKRIKYEAEEKAKISGFPTAKQLREAKEIAEARLRREDHEEEQVGLKRKGKNSSLQRPFKVPSVQPQHYHHHPSQQKELEDVEVVDDMVHFRVNFDKFNIHIRDSLVVRAARERFDKGAAQVLQTVLKIAEPSQRHILEVRSEPVTLPSIILQLSENDELMSGLALASKKAPKSTYIKEYLGMLSSADNPTPAGKAGSFISFGGSKVQVEFETVAHRLRRRVLEFVARERHGAEGVRILRLLLDTGKMDEKQIAKVVMMALKDVRPLLAALAADSLINTQEIPKSADRNPTRTFYLWYVDTAKVYSVLLGNVYKTLYNIGIRRRAEEEASDVKAVLEKRQRSDVSQDESLLTRLERDILKEWGSKQRRLTVLEERVEETVFILKDLGGFGIHDD